jgi:23S rRNA (cytidine2498-2'-O)-methyltransferase
LPIYLHHLCPVQFNLRLDGSRADLLKLQQVVKLRFDTQRPLIVQPRILTRRADLSSCYSADDIVAALDNRVGATAGPDSDVGNVLSIVVTLDRKLRAYMGVSSAIQNLSPWPGGVRPYLINMPNRAGYKLLEALDTFQIRLRAGQRALDLGAAPGAWTLVLRQHGLHVTAVSPQRLYPELRRDCFVVHRRMDAESYLQRVKGTFDVITNDMIMDAQDSARLMVAYAQHLQPQGLAIMTLKLRLRNQRRVMDHSFRILRKAYRILRVRQLVSNGKEVTLLLRKRNDVSTFA